MLGIGRASQYAGWWSGGNPSVTFTTTSDLAYTNFQTPSYSLLTGVGGSPANSWDVVNSGSYDITGYSSLSGFNNARSTQVATIYIEWPTSGISSGAFVGYTQYCQMKQNGTTFYYNCQWQLTNSNTQLNILGGVPGGNTLTLPGSYTQYMGRWLTVVWSCSETQSSYTNWGTSGGTGNYARTAVFDTESGELISKLDYRTTTTLCSWSTWPTTVPAVEFGNNYAAEIGGFGSGSSPDYYNTRFSNFWASFGTMFDPLTTTNTSWRTTRPSSTIDTAVAWQNLQLTDYQVISSNYYVNTSDMDLYSQASGVAAKTGGWSSTEWTNNYSSTNITKDSA